MSISRLKTVPRRRMLLALPAAGQAKGDGLNAAGGLWHEITTSGTAAPAPAGSSSAGSGGPGTGY